MYKKYFKIHKPVQIVHGVSGEDDTRTPGHRSQAPAQSEPEVSMCMCCLSLPARLGNFTIALLILIIIHIL